MRVRDFRRNDVQTSFENLEINEFLQVSASLTRFEIIFHQKERTCGLLLMQKVLSFCLAGRPGFE